MSTLSIPALETDRLIIRGHTPADIEASATMWSDPEVVKLISGQPSTKAQCWSRILTYAGLWHYLGYGYWAVCDKGSKEFLGEVGFADFKRELTPPVGGVPEIGWAFQTRAQGNGYAIEAVRGILEWSDRSLEAAKTYCIFDPDHARSMKLAEKAGYEMEAKAQNPDKDVLIMSRERNKAGNP